MKKLLLIVSIVCSVPSFCFAQTTYTLPVNKPIQVSSFSIGDKFQVYATGKNSYCCSIFGALTSNTFTISNVNNNSSSFSSTFRPRGMAIPELGSALTSQSVNKRQCWHEGNTTISSLPLFTVAASGSGAATMLCENSTLVGGFNTSVTDFNFLELSVNNDPSNSFEDNLKGIILINRTIAGSTVEIPFEIKLPQGSDIVRKDFNIHAAVSNAKDFGQVVILHDGSAEQVSAKMTQYRIVSTTPLDFEPVLQEVFTRKGR